MASDLEIKPARLKWVPYWLAVLPVIYVLSPFSLSGLPQLRKLPRHVLYILIFYALSQQIPALFSPEPLLASILAIIRTLLLFGLIGVGVKLGETVQLRPLGVGLAIVVLTALVFSFRSGLDVFVGRLSHPYMTPSSIGLAGTLGLWLACFIPGNILWRTLLGFLSVIGIFLSGSRGAFAAALLGCIVGTLASSIRHSTRLTTAVLTTGTLLGGAFLTGERLGLNFMTRLTIPDITGRDVLWANTLSVIQAHPWSGVGSYRLGMYLAPPGEPCTFFSRSDGLRPVCPSSLDQLGSPWLIAHNASLQQLSETGPLGFLGLMTLLGAVVFSALLTKHPLSLAIVSGMILSTINDNTLLVPSPFFAEVFWVVAGMNLMRLPPPNLPIYLTAVFTTLLVSSPLFLAYFSSRQTTSSVPIKLNFIQASNVVSTPEDYVVRVMLDLPPNPYRIVLKSCLLTCTTINETTSISLWKSDTPPLLTLKGDLRHVSVQQLRLQVLPDRASFNLRPLAERTWLVRVKP